MEDQALSASRSDMHSLSDATIPPQAVEAEQSVLGGLMLNNMGWEQIGDALVSDDFYRKEHRLIFHALMRLLEENKPADVLTVGQELEQLGQLPEAGGAEYLVTLANNTPSAANIVSYAEIVRERAMLRRLIAVSHDIASKAYRPEGQSATEILDQAETTILEVSDAGSRRGGFKELKKFLTSSINRIEELYKSDNPITGVGTGYADFDDKTSGLQPADLVIIAGRPSMGKTSLAMNMAENAAVGDKTAVAIFSMEMPGEQLAMRMMSSLGRINAHRVRTGKLDDEDWPRLTSAMGMLVEAPIYIDDTPGLTPMEVRAKARRLDREHRQKTGEGLGMIVIDYLQLMQTGQSAENRATEVSLITRSLKGLAKELHVPVVALSQLNRSLEQRPNKRPVMSDLRESGAIEQDADVIVFIYRDEVYNEDSPDKGTAEIIISKQRNGPIGTVRLTFLGEYTRFENFVAGNFDEVYG